MNLTWEDLNEWAGERIVKRGKSYERSVEDLRITSDGALLATIHGTKAYSTRAGMNDNGELFSECTCPYSWGPCKHAVAVILVYLNASKNKQKVLLATPDDERLLEFTAGDDESDDWDYEEGNYSDAAVVRQRHSDKKCNGVRSHLKSLSKKELVDLVMNGENIVPELGRKLADCDNLKKGDIGKLVASIRKEIKAISSEPAWTSHWNDEGEIPDYSPVKKRLETLLSNNHADAVVELGIYLMECGIKQIEQSNILSERLDKLPK